MTDINTTFCRMLWNTMQDNLKKIFPAQALKTLRKHAWAYRYSDGSTEFHINANRLLPEGYFRTLKRTSNLSEAKYEGWSTFLTSLAHDDIKLKNIKLKWTKEMKDDYKTH